MSTITTERLTKILSETQAVINECNSRGVHGSVEVNARLFENVLMELLLHRAAMLQGAEQTNYRAIVERIAEIVHGKVTDIDLLTVTVKSMKDNLHGRAEPRLHIKTAPLQEVKQCT